jgi:hypothetical protein
MQTGPKQHIVPQQMIRRFANERGQLRAMRKPSFAVLGRPKGPKGILWKENYYKDTSGDLDADWLTAIEQRFAKYYAALADEPWRRGTAPKEEGEAFVDWTISQLCRTELIPKATESLMLNKPSLLQAAYVMDPTLFHNTVRPQLFEHLKEVYTLPGWRWNCFIISTDANLVLTDHPVCSTASNTWLGHVVFVPLSKKRIIFGGGGKSLERVTGLSVLKMNCILASWAEEWIYAAADATLLEVARELKGEGAVTDKVWLEAARKPLFGRTERAAISPAPDSSDVFDKMKRHYNVADAKQL